MSEHQIIEQLKQLMVEELDLNLTIDSINEHITLFQGGLNIDSLSIVNFIMIIETHFNFEWDIEDLQPDNFKNLATLAHLIAQRQQERI